MNTNIKTILIQYKNEHLTLDEAAKEIASCFSSGVSDWITIDTTVTASVAIGIQAFHNQFECELVSCTGVAEGFMQIVIKGPESELRKLNDKAVRYRPSECRSESCS